MVDVLLEAFCRELGAAFTSAKQSQQQRVALKRLANRRFGDRFDMSVPRLVTPSLGRLDPSSESDSKGGGGGRPTRCMAKTGARRGGEGQHDADGQRWEGAANSDEFAALGEEASSTSSSWAISLGALLLVCRRRGTKAGASDDDSVSIDGRCEWR